MHTGPQASQLLKLAEKKDLEPKVFHKVLELFAVLLLAAKAGKLPTRTDFRKYLGLGVPTAFLCELVSHGLDGHGLLAAVEAKDRKVGDYAKGILLGNGQDPFPASSPKGTKHRLGVIYSFEVEGRTNADIDKEMLSRGVKNCHPEVAPYLRERYSQKDLLALVNASRPEDCPVITLVVVRHKALRDSDGIASLFGLGQAAGEDDVSAYRAAAEGGWLDGVAFVVLQQEDSAHQV